MIKKGRASVYLSLLTNQTKESQRCEQKNTKVLHQTSFMPEIRKLKEFKKS